jgi:ribose 5-phosphate isomerase A
VPFGLALAKRKLEALGLPSDVRQKDGKAFVSDNGNPILDCKVGRPIDDPAALDRDILLIPGVVGTGLFYGMADVVLVQDGNDVRTLTR